MTAHQTAVAAAADLKWLTNSASLLRRRLRYSAEAARWWGLVHVLVDELGLTLKAAADAATTALRPRAFAAAPARTDNAGAARIEVDLQRYDSIFLANLSRALIQETPRRRGRLSKIERDAIAAARRYGIDTGLLQTALERTPAERLALLETNVEFVRAARRVG
ncbi:MAG TPA: hypothetical protein VF105_08695 [Gemmatimonadaceae bacterium]